MVVTVFAFPVIKRFDVIEDVPPSFIQRQVDAAASSQGKLGHRSCDWWIGSKVDALPAAAIFAS